MRDLPEARRHDFNMRSRKREVDKPLKRRGLLRRLFGFFAKPVSAEPPSKTSALRQHSPPPGIRLYKNVKLKEGYTVNTLSEDESRARFGFLIWVDFERIPRTFIRLCSIMPRDVYVILESASKDHYAYAEDCISLYMSKSLMPTRDFIEEFLKYAPSLAMDGMLGTGIMSCDPDMEVFISTDKVIRVFTDNYGEVAGILEQMDIPYNPQMNFVHDYPHVHRSTAGRTGDWFLPSHLKVRDHWTEHFDMDLDVEETENVDEKGNSMGKKPWIAELEIRWFPSPCLPSPPSREAFHQTVGVTAISAVECREFLDAEMREESQQMIRIKELYRVRFESVPEYIRSKSSDYTLSGVWYKSELTPVNRRR